MVVEPEEADVAPAPETGVRGRVLDKACVSCGGPIIRPVHAKGRPPTRCDDCRKPSKTLGTVGGNKKRYARTHPEPGKRICAKCGLAKDEATGFKVKNHKTGTVESYCQDCRSTYMASRYARVGSKVVTVELLEGDVAIGARCPDCGQPFQAGQRVQGEHLHHENCPG